MIYEKVTKKIIVLMKSESSARQFQEQFLKILQKAIPFDAACFTTIDPSTFLSTGAYTDQRIEKIHPQLFMNEFLEDDYNKFKDLARNAPHAAALGIVTNGEQIMSSRYREILKPAGFVDEVRAACMSKGKCFGHLSLFRGNTRVSFQQNECEYLSKISSIVGDTLRKSFITYSEEQVEVVGTGTIILNEKFNLLYWDQNGKAWLSTLRTYEQLNEDDVPRPIRAVCSRVKANESNRAATDEGEMVCIGLFCGQFLVIRASRLEGYGSCNDGYIVLFERARPKEVFPLIADSYSLSQREKQVIVGIVRGMSTKDVAEELHISTYTVQDHFKSIFEKVGVCSRNELIWEVFSKFCFSKEK
ncbi:helix-turn-helix transcriptional regulator [Bacillus mycoides]|uniref:helix-turn-helix transcriptional regulator n=1 Tax=Bacillus mycoides TaxID=1405 RepID=UPI0011A48B0A|nr:helix-turn-helix transcriptional regulator [Bacillus mycoides]